MRLGRASGLGISMFGIDENLLKARQKSSRRNHFIGKPTAFT